jgi:hypothetical protein
MEKQAGDRLVHHYDTQQRRILCGAPVADDHSTKHARGVTCQACIALLRESEDAPARAGDASASSAAGV